MNYIVSDTDLTSIADAIRAKTGKTGKMSFPSIFSYWISTLIVPSELNLTTATTTITGYGNTISETTLISGQRFKIGTISATLPSGMIILKEMSVRINSLMTIGTVTVISGFNVTPTSSPCEYVYEHMNTNISGSTISMDVYIRMTKGSARVSGRPSISIPLTYTKSAI